MAEFYRNLAADYPLLFPARLAQLDTLANLAGEPPCRVVDVASGTGEYVAGLTARGYEAFGVEVDPAMHALALERHPELEHHLVHGDMLELVDEVRGPVSLAYCIGNSLPHLSSLADVSDVLAQMWDITRPAGSIVLQVNNFDRVLVEQREESREAIFDLPTISASRPDGSLVELERRYFLFSRREGDSGEVQKLRFRTLHRSDGGVVESELMLLVLTRDELEKCLPAEATATWYGGFDGSEWSASTPATVVVLK